VFVRDLVAHVTRRVSVGPGGVQANGFSRYPAISADGRNVVFESDADNLVGGDTNGAVDVFVRDRVAHVTRRVSVDPGGAQANGDSSNRPAISADARYVAFDSYADNLVAGDTNDTGDVFLRILSAGWTDPPRPPREDRRGAAAPPWDWVGTRPTRLTILDKRSSPPCASATPQGVVRLSLCCGIGQPG
jgi:hypothetical protein